MVGEFRGLIRSSWEFGCSVAGFIGLREGFWLGGL